MNKKKLSVVMAGAMLATSVAPVLAAPVEYGTSQKKLVAKEITDLVESGKISANTTLKGTDFVSTEVANLMDDDYSVYGIKVLDENGKAIDLTTAGNKFAAAHTVSGDNTLTYNIADIKSILVDEDLKENMTIQVVERENSKFLGQVIPGSQIVGNGVSEANKFTADAFASDSAFKSATHANIKNVGSTSFIKSVEVDAKAGTAKVTLNAVKDLTAEKTENISFDFKAGDEKLNFDLPLDSKGDLITDSTKIMDCVGFAKKETYTKSQLTKADPTIKSEYKLVDDSAKVEKVTYLAKDLYDGLALTAKGTEIQLDLENAKKVNNETGKALTVELGNDSDLTLTGDGVASFTVTYFDSYKDNVSNSSDDKPSKIVTIKSTNLEEIKSLYKMLTTGEYEVGVIGGANRYETAVNVAKAQKLAKVNPTEAALNKENHIVLVNGGSLVDGLAAAPLAASLKWNNASTGTAVLLSKEDSLPKETKSYLEELTSEIPVAKRKYVTIDLVGGESVLKESLVKELKDMGFSVERYGGDNREETSLEVATAIKPNSVNGVFIVGANGEADAMSIATIASKRKAPIVVAKAGGLSNNAVKFIKNNYSNVEKDRIAVIGGELSVSKAEYDKIDAVVETKVVRVSGANRFETNAAIVNKYSGNFGEVILVKDGQSNKDELIDALSAANYAIKSSPSSPIVLATDKITDAQKTAILNQKGNVTKLTQVGQGVTRTTLESVAEFLGLSNVK